jgi:exosome complex RNA-binding protein Csl4
MPKFNLRQNHHVESDADISSTGEIVRAEVPSDHVVSVNIEATADASYAIDVAAVDDPGADDWFEGEVTYDQADESDPQDIRDTFVLGDRWMRIRVTTAAGAGETATVTLQGAK